MDCIRNYADGINESGQIVGSSDCGNRFSSRQVIFLYSEGQMWDLNTLVSANSDWVFYTANDINDAGQLVGTGYFQGQQRAFLLTPDTAVPEPATNVLSGLTLLSLVLMSPRVF